MAKTRHRLRCGAGIGGLLILIGLFAVIAGSIDLEGLIHGFGGTVSHGGAEAIESSGTATLWGGLLTIGLGVVLFFVCVAVFRRREEFSA